MKSFKIKTFGCKVNQYESQLMRERLFFAGYTEAEDGQEADLCIVNTCTVTARADKDCREAIRRFTRERPGAEIIAAGCYVETSPEAIRSIDQRIKILSNKDKIKDVAGAQMTRKGISYFKAHEKAFIKVQDGCNNFCSYCIVPYVRGRSKSRNREDILEEARRLIDKGYHELVLTGICLGDFGKDLDNITLTSLIKKICDFEGDFRVRLSSIELPDVDDDLISYMRDSKKLCHHLHIPLQSGDDEILRNMKRRYTSSEFIKRIRCIRSKIPDIGITTDLIVGFPGESDENFKNTLMAIKSIQPSRTHIFTYSPRKGTQAFDMKDTVSKEVKRNRYKQIKDLTDRFAKDFRLQSLGKRQRILVEGVRDENSRQLTGYTDTYIKVLVDLPGEFIGKLVCENIK